ncbi:hypothetical protein ACFQU7_22005 [Pseudoroseomonas wenyumeiae]
MLNNLAFEVPSAEAQAQMRERLMAYQGAVNETRTALQRFLATEEVAQNRRAKRAVAQARVHGRGLRAGQMSEQFGQDLERLLAQGEVIAATAQELITAMEAAAALRAERVVPARAALESAMARASERMAGNVALGMAATQVAIEDVRNEALLAAAATVDAAAGGLGHGAGGGSTAGEAGGGAAAHRRRRCRRAGAGPCPA